jgi:hypothetical protein
VNGDGGVLSSFLHPILSIEKSLLPPLT